MKTMIRLALVALVVGFALPAQAQFGGHGKGRGGPPSPEKMEKMKKFRAKALRDTVGLSEEKATEVEKVMDSFHERRFELHQTMRDNMKSLKTLLKDDSNDQKAYENVLETLRITQEELQALKAEQMDAFKGILTPKEGAKMLVVMKKFRGKARGFKRGKMGRGMGPPDDFDGPPDFDDGDNE
jgi:Spy/CpxP family protein refolding chaperone